MRQNWFLTRWTGHASAEPSAEAPACPAGDLGWAGDAPDPDDPLAAALRSGTPQAARQLYDAYARPLHRFVHRRTGDAELAQDMVQDVMVRVWQAAPRFDPSL